MSVKLYFAEGYAKIKAGFQNKSLLRGGKVGNIQRKPDWLRAEMLQRYTGNGKNDAQEVRQLMSKLQLNTVCEEANCPNQGECFANRTATFMIMGNRCTRNCLFCDVAHGTPISLDTQEPQRVAEAVVSLGLKHVVVTSVTRDDLPHGGAEQFTSTTRAIRAVNPAVTIELLIPDLLGNEESLDIVLDSTPDVLNHNMETVRSLYEHVRPQAEYERSLHVLAHSKKSNAATFVKTGIMVGLGETDKQVHQLMDDILKTGCDFLTIGQYLRPSKEHYPVCEYVKPEQFEKYKKVGLEKGFTYVASAPLVRSSYHAESALNESRGYV